MFQESSTPSSFSNPALPFAGLQAPVNVDKRRNFFEIQGNHVKFNKNPFGKVPVGWWWHSSMPVTNEVHGEILGWENVPFQVTGADDFGFHEALCTGAPFKQMLQEASAALAAF